MNELTKLISQFLEAGDGSETNSEVFIKEEDEKDVIIYNYAERIQFQIYIPKNSTLEGYIIWAITNYQIPQVAFHRAISVLNSVNCWTNGVGCGALESDRYIWFMCSRFNHNKISEGEFESDFRRVLGYCWYNMPMLIEEIRTAYFTDFTHKSPNI